MMTIACLRVLGVTFGVDEARRLFDRFTLDTETTHILDEFCAVVIEPFPWSEEVARRVDEKINTVLAIIMIAKGHVLADPETTLAELYRPTVKSDGDSLF